MTRECFLSCPFVSLQTYPTADITPPTDGLSSFRAAVQSVRWQLWLEELCGRSAFVQLHPFPLCPVCKLSQEVSLGTCGRSLAHLSVSVGNHALIGCCRERCKRWTSVHTSNLRGVWRDTTETLKIMTTAICNTGWEVLAKLKLGALHCDPPNPGCPTVLEVNWSSLGCRRKYVSS